MALEVVYRRLQEIGIGPFCLELHSKKSEKKEVVRSFYEALEFASPNINGGWEQVAGELKTSRDGLNEYFKELHDKSTSGITAYKAFGVASRKKGVENVDLQFDSFLECPENKLNELIVKVKTWKGYADVLTDEEYKAWSFVKRDSWSSEMEDTVVSELKAIQNDIDHITNLEKDTSKKFPVVNSWSAKSWGSVKLLVENLLTPPAVTSSFLKQTDFVQFQRELSEKVDHLKNQAELREKLDKEFQPQVYQENFYQLKQQLDDSNEGFFIIKFFKRRKLKGQLQKLAKGKVGDLSGYGKLLEAGIAYQEGKSKEEQSQQFAKEVFGQEYFLGKDEDVHKAMNWLNEVYGEMMNLYSSDLEALKAGRGFVKDIVENRDLILAMGGDVRRELSDLLDFAENFQKKLWTKKKFVSSSHYTITLDLLTPELKQEAVNNLRGKAEITRFKGLGEISPDEFVHFIGADIRLDPVMLDKAMSIEELLSFYMGKNTPDRQKFIINNFETKYFKLKTYCIAFFILNRQLRQCNNKTV